MLIVNSTVWEELGVHRRGKRRKWEGLESVNIIIGCKRMWAGQGGCMGAGGKGVAQLQVYKKGVRGGVLMVVGCEVTLLIVATFSEG